MGAEDDDQAYRLEDGEFDFESPRYSRKQVLRYGSGGWLPSRLQVCSAALILPSPACVPARR